MFLEKVRVFAGRSNPTSSAAKPPFFPGKTRFRGRLWRLTGRLTRGQGSAQDDAACASMHVHGRAGKPKQLARNAKNPGKTFGFAAERTGTEQPANPLGNSHFDTTRDAKYDARRFHCL